MNNSSYSVYSLIGFHAGAPLNISVGGSLLGFTQAQLY